VSASMQALLAQLPAVHVLADRARAHSEAPRWALVEAARQAVARRRAAILAGETHDAEIGASGVAALAGALARPSLRRVVNATGVVLHTNLGRAPLPTAAIDAIGNVAAGYSNLEYDLAAGQRGSRHDHLRELLRQLTGAEDAVVVNNNAAATVLGLAALAAGRGVVVSRGEQIEIGGSFRLPEILALSGCRMIEVGTTNKTHLADYRKAAEADAGTALLLKVHRSNFAIVGFTAEVSAEELVALAGELASEAPEATMPRLAVMLDLGSGAFLSAELQRAAGLPVEPTVAEAVRSGADLISFSGDKLLGGPQAGILVGRAAAIARARKHPLMRVLRPDKLTIAALEATLACYRDGRLDDVPTIASLRRPAEELRALAEDLITRLRRVCKDQLSLTLCACTSTVGGGAMPTAALPSWAIALTHAKKRAAELQATLCALQPPLSPILGRIDEGRLLLDLRTVADDELPRLQDALYILSC
jgi:L-seryl-tRNA(Ser) seleniumtransferase